MKLTRKTIKLPIRKKTIRLIKNQHSNLNRNRKVLILMQIIKKIKQQTVKSNKKKNRRYLKAVIKNKLLLLISLLKEIPRYNLQNNSKLLTNYRKKKRFNYNSKNKERKINQPILNLKKKI